MVKSLLLHLAEIGFFFCLACIVFSSKLFCIIIVSCCHRWNSLIRCPFLYDNNRKFIFINAVISFVIVQKVFAVQIYMTCFGLSLLLWGPT